MHRIRPIQPVFALLACVLPMTAVADDGRWDYLVTKLVADGIPRARARAVFQDCRVPRFSGLEFKLQPREPSSMYRRFRTGRDVDAARRCRARYDAEFRSAERRLGVPASVLTAILHVETHCGTNTGTHVVLYRLARLAMANEPGNVQQNIKRQTRGLSRATAERVGELVRKRARTLEALFYPEVVATFRLADRLGVDPLSIRGSPSGAFGLPQFLPSSYLRFGADGDGDGRVSLYHPADAITSTANFLHGNGWKPAARPARQREVIWMYNRSDAYIDTVVFLAEQVERSHPSRPRAARAAPDDDVATTD